MPATGSYDHTADYYTHAHRPDIQIPNLKLYRDKKLGERAGKDGPYYIQAPYDSYDPSAAFGQSINTKITNQNINQRRTDWDKTPARDDIMYKTIEFGAHVALENTKEERQAEFDKARREKRELAMIKAGILPGQSYRNKSERRNKS